MFKDTQGEEKEVEEAKVMRKRQEIKIKHIRDKENIGIG